MPERRVTLRLERDPDQGKVTAQILGATTLGSFESHPSTQIFEGSCAAEVFEKLGAALDEEDAPKPRD